MTNATMTIQQFEQTGNTVHLTVSFQPTQPLAAHRAAVIFTADGENRRLPMNTEVKDGAVFAYGVYEAPYLFYQKNPKTIGVSFVFGDGTDNGTIYPTDLVIKGGSKAPLLHFIKAPTKEKKKVLVGVFFNLLSLPFRLLPVKPRRITFLTNRTDTPTGNLKAVYQNLQTLENADLRLLCRSGGAAGTLKLLPQFLYLYMTSKIVFVDDYYHLISFVKKKRATKLIQLWHGCGAFKTFGFSRYHKDSALELGSANHRQYDYAVVSSPDAAPFYAEAFGISSEKAVALGSPRCDCLTDSAYQAEMRAAFYEKYPQLQGKKHLLFAPTFRGGGNGDCYYPTEQFSIDKMLKTLGEDWSIIIKLHPYLTEKFTFSEQYADRVVDCFEWDINDLLFVTDYLVTDYSSVIFEAALLEIPMAFLAFDLDEYIAKRDFYYDFRQFVPAPVAADDTALADIIQNTAPDMARIRAFKAQAFGDTAGNACENVRKLTEEILEDKR